MGWNLFEADVLLKMAAPEYKRMENEHNAKAHIYTGSADGVGRSDDRDRLAHTANKTARLGEDRADNRRLSGGQCEDHPRVGLIAVGDH
jgi:hypothetical protein